MGKRIYTGDLENLFWKFPVVCCGYCLRCSSPELLEQCEQHSTKSHILVSLPLPVALLRSNLHQFPDLEAPENVKPWATWSSRFLADCITLLQLEQFWTEFWRQLWCTHPHSAQLMNMTKGHVLVQRGQSFRGIARQIGKDPDASGRS